MSSEPCRHERDYTTAQAMKSYIDAAKIAGDAAIERNAALAENARQRATLAKVAAIVADPHAAMVVDRVRAVLEETDSGYPIQTAMCDERAKYEPTDQPKGTT